MAATRGTWWPSGRRKGVGQLPLPLPLPLPFPKPKLKLPLELPFRPPKLKFPLSLPFRAPQLPLPFRLPLPTPTLPLPLPLPQPKHCALAGTVAASEPIVARVTRSVLNCMLSLHSIIDVPVPSRHLLLVPTLASRVEI